MRSARVHKGQRESNASMRFSAVVLKVVEMATLIEEEVDRLEREHDLPDSAQADGGRRVGRRADVLIR